VEGAFERIVRVLRSDQRLGAFKTAAKHQRQQEASGSLHGIAHVYRSTNGSRTRIVSSRSGLVESKATGAPISSSTRRIYLIAVAGRSAQERAPRVDSRQPASVSYHRLDLRLFVRVGRQIIEVAPAQPVARADFDFLETVEHVELGQGNPVDTAGDDGLAHQHRVEPAAAPLAPGDCAEFRAGLADPFADFIVQFRREGPIADPRRVGLGNAEHEADVARATARTRGRLSRHCVGRGDIRIGAVIDIEQRALRPFEQHAAALMADLFQFAPHRPREGQHLGRDLGERAQERRRIHLLDARGRGGACCDGRAGARFSPSATKRP